MGSGRQSAGRRDWRPLRYGDADLTTALVALSPQGAKILGAALGGKPHHLRYWFCAESMCLLKHLAFAGPFPGRKEAEFSPNRSQSLTMRLVVQGKTTCPRCRAQLITDHTGAGRETLRCQRCGHCDTAAAGAARSVAAEAPGGQRQRCCPAPPRRR